jgi:hypothetical protein
MSGVKVKVIAGRSTGGVTDMGPGHTSEHMLSEWRGAVVDPGGGMPDPGPDRWEPVEVPGRPATFADADAVAYRTSFEDPRSSDEERALLTLHGLYAHARVWLNDDLVADRDTYFEPLEVDFVPEATNHLVVECRRPTDRFGGSYDTGRVPDRLSVPGIWWTANVEGTPAAYVADLQARPRVSDGDAAIDVAIDLVAGRAVDERLTLTLRPAGDLQHRGTMERVSIAADAGERTTIEHTIELRDPALWWPRGFGQQHRYEVAAKLDGHTASTTTGLSTVAYDDGDLTVNGRRVPARGVNLLDATPADVERAAELNANFVRLNAHVASPAVYEACDREGMLVWQDLPLTGPEPFDVERGSEVAAALAAQCDRHPSLMAFGVHDDPVATFDGSLGAGLLDRFRLRWRAYRTGYDRGDADAVAAVLPDDCPTFPVVGPPGTDPDAAVLFPGWDYGDADTVEWLLSQYPSLSTTVAAFGAGSLGTDDPRDVEGFDLDRLDALTDGGDAATTQAYQARVVETVAEALRREGNGLMAAFTLRDLTDAGMGVLTKSGGRKAAADALEAAYEPIQAVLRDPTAGESDVVVVNDTPKDLTGTLFWRNGEGDGEADVRVDAEDTTTATTVRANGHVELTLRVGDHEVTNSYER